MKAEIKIDDNAHQQKLLAAVSQIGTRTLAATEEALEDIAEASLAQVPRDTNTLANSIFYDIGGSSGGFHGVVGYGGGAVNPVSGVPVSTYMVRVHEDLTVSHPVGKAKFLEDPVREYTENEYDGVVIKHVEPLIR